MGTPEQKHKDWLWEQDGVVECPHCHEPIFIEELEE